MTDAATPLKELAESRFNQDIRPAEEKLFGAAAAGHDADCTSLADRVIRADRLSWLCANREASAKVTYRGLSLVGAEIDGEMDLQWARISFPITASKCFFKGAVDLSHSYIAFVSFSGSFLSAAGSSRCQFALKGEDTHFEGDVYLHKGFRAEGGVNLASAKIDGHLDCEGGEFIGKDSTLALDANGAEVKGGVFLRRGFKAEGGVDLASAKIDGHLDCSGGEFIGKDSTLALDANGAKVKSGAFLRKVVAEGGVDLRQAQIDGSLDCRGGNFIGKDKKPALNANGAKVMGVVSLSNGFRAEGGVNLLRAKIGINLECDNGQFISGSDAPALIADGAKIDGAVHFRAGFVAIGEVDFENAKIDGAFRWTQAKSPEEATLNLRGAKAGMLLNSQDSWPKQGHLKIDGFVYYQISDLAPPDAEVQLGWLELQPQDRFLSQPFEQLATVLRNMGLEEHARTVMIAKNEKHARYVRWRPEWLWYGLFGKIIDYGYRPWRAFYASLVFVALGWWIFGNGYHTKLITPPDVKAYADERGVSHQLSEWYPRFNAIMYSVETFVPLVKLGMSEYWKPNPTRHHGRLQFLGFFDLPISGRLLRYYLCFHVIAGWVLLPLWLGGLTGLVKT